MGVGKRLKRILSQKGMSIKELSELSGISKNTLYSITKRDSKKVDYYTIGLIARTLQIDPNELLSDPLPPELEDVKQKIISQRNRFRLALSMLNFDGKEKVTQYAEDLSQIEKYQTSNDNLKFMSDSIRQAPAEIKDIYKKDFPETVSDDKTEDKNSK